jgi:hypothetical protein
LGAITASTRHCRTYGEVWLRRLRLKQFCDARRRRKKKEESLLNASTK